MTKERVLLSYSSATLLSVPPSPHSIKAPPSPLSSRLSRCAVGPKRSGAEGSAVSPSPLTQAGLYSLFLTQWGRRQQSKGGPGLAFETWDPCSLSRRAVDQFQMGTPPRRVGRPMLWVPHSSPRVGFKPPSGGIRSFSPSLFLSPCQNLRPQLLYPITSLRGTKQDLAKL